MILELCRSKYYGHRHSEILAIVRKQIIGSIEHIESEMLSLFYDFLNKEPYYYWNRDVFNKTVEGLETLYDEHYSELQITENILEHFLFGLNTYRQTAEVISDLRNVNDNPEIKTRLYRIPTYISIVEGCLSNLYKVLTLLLDQTTDKDYKSQSKLNPLCTILKNNDFELLVVDVNIDIRNAINHGGVIYKNVDGSPTLEFQYSKNREQQILHMKLYEFDELIDQVFDVASAIILGLVTYLNNHKNLFQVNLKEKLFIPFSLLALELSIPEARCRSISDLPNDKQLNIDMYIKNTDAASINEMSIILSLLAYERYNDYAQFMISFSNERLPSSWIRFTNNEVERILFDVNNIERVFEEVIDRGDYVVWSPSTEKIDLNEIKYFRFPNYKDARYSINQIEDASITDRKRLKGHLYLGDIDTREEIIEIIKNSIDWVKNLKNVPSPTFHVKNGEMEADSVYLNVYRKDTRKNKATVLSNDNFVCKVDYNIDGKTTLKNGGIGSAIWNQLSKEQQDNILIAWNGSQYRERMKVKIRRNDLCPCGSKRKYKKCCIK
ncbi:SEC-C domain-containing protein [Bacillus altitudinis]|uniref:YecA family protein n=1 Tax=Bacillus altitudinis TaxID=293387 RepID=UPI002E22DBD0|nr:SEC-C domain-containing protein [Bacillus altitudinis]